MNVSSIRYKKSSRLRLCSGVISFLFLLTHSAFAKNGSCQTLSGFIDMNLAPSLLSTNGGEGSEDGKGIGGTGLQPVGSGDGVGGTGSPFDSAYISGVVYDYGSLCINGLRVQYDEKTPVYLNGTRIKSTALSLGSTVKVLSKVDSGSGALHADRIDLERIITGPVTAIDESKQTITVMNDMVLLGAPGLSFSVGDIISVSGYRGTDGKILASAVEKLSPSAEQSLVGPLRKSNEGQWLIGSTPVAPGKLNVSDDGTTVLVEGKWDGENFSVTRQTRLSPLPVTRSPEKVYISYEGVLESFSEDRKIVLGGLTATVRDLLCGGEPLEKGERIIAMGTIRPDGSVFFDGLIDSPLQAARLYESGTAVAPKTDKAYND